MTLKTRVVLALVFSAVAGCARSSVVRSAVPERINYAANARMRGPFVPAGTEFTVLLDQAVGTQVSAAGDIITARVQAPLRAPDGSVVIPAGAVLRGHVDDVAEGRLPVVILAFDTIETPGGTVPISAAVRTAGRFVYRAAYHAAVPVEIIPQEEAQYGPTLSGEWRFQNTAGPAAGGVGPNTLMRPREVYVPRGGWVRLVLNEPIVAR